MSKFIGVAEVEEGDEVRITMTFDDDAESVTTGRVRQGYNVVTDRSELSIGAMHIDSLTKFPMVKNYTIELLRRDEKHGYYLATPKDSWDRVVRLWKYDSEWRIVKSPPLGDFVTDHDDGDGPSAKRLFIGTELPGLDVQAHGDTY